MFKTRKAADSIRTLAVTACAVELREAEAAKWEHGGARKCLASGTNVYASLATIVVGKKGAL